MSLTKNRLYLLKEVFTKVKYDELNERFYIALEDYSFLSLEPPQLVLLNNMCNENNIYLETLPKRLKGIETQELFDKYKKLKEKLNETRAPLEKENLEKLLQEIKDKVILGHMRQVYCQINKRVPNIKNREDKEDIYQIGYETLMEFFDKYNPEKDTTFAYFINEYIIHRIIRKIHKNTVAIGSETITTLAKVKKAKKSLEEEKENYTIDELVKKTGIKKEKLKEILALETIMTMPTTDFEKEPIEDDLIDYHFEEDIIEQIQENNHSLEKLVNLLPEKERIVIRLYYGFEDGTVYTYEEIAEKIGLSRQRVEQLKALGLTSLANRAGSKYLKDIYGETKYTSENQDVILSSLETEKIKRDFILDIIEPEIILSLINELNPLNKEIMLLHYGLKDGKKYEMGEISEIIDLRKFIVGKHLKSSTDLLIKRIVKKENPQFEGDYLEYLISKYLNNSKSKRK